MKAKPLRDFVFVSKDDQVKKSSSGLYLAGEEKHTTGTVLAVGDGKYDNNGTVISPSVKVGDVVMFHKNMAIEVTVDNTAIFILKDEQLFCVL